MLNRYLKIILVSVLVVALIISSYPSFVSSSSGNVKINTIGTSVVGQQVQAGGTINLYFGGVMWSGQDFYLFLSQDGNTQMTGQVYTPTFSVYDVADPTKVINCTGENGYWLVGSQWVNGTIPTWASGNYYIKAMDQIGGSVAVTDTYVAVIPINYTATLEITPTSGPGGIPITFTGSRYPINQNVSIYFLDPQFGWKYLTSATADGNGRISVSSFAPDLKKSLGTYDSPETYSTISYRSAIGNVVFSNADYNEYHRGLKKVGTATSNGLFGNGTNLVQTVRLKVGDTIPISGNWFHPGIVYIRWDGVDVVGTVTSSQWSNISPLTSTATNATGFFSTTITIPGCNAGEHYLAVEDSQSARVIVKIFVSQGTLELSPASGPGGATVQFSGSGYPSSTEVGLYYLDNSFGSWNIWTTTTADADGKISFSAEIPDLKNSCPAGEYGNSSNKISFRTQVNNLPYSYSDYTQFGRGLQQVGSRTVPGLIGNGTNLGNITVKPGDSLYIYGKWFHPGIVYIRFDGVAVVGTVTAQQWQSAQVIGSTTASQTGSFQTYATIPSASGGTHYIAIDDTQTIITIQVNVSATVIATPTPIPTATPTISPTSNPKASPTPNPSLPAPTIDLSCKSTTSVSGSKVEINGKLLLNGNPVAESPILVAYSITGGNTWISLTLLNTLSDGRFVAVWNPDVTGNYMVKATSEGTSTMKEANKVVNLALTPENPQDPDQNVFTLTSNSTITQFAFDPDRKELSFIASGPSDTRGYVNIYIPKTILSDISQLKAYLDGNEISFDSESQTYSWLITFSYSHSQHTITMSISDSAVVSAGGSVPQWLFYVIPVAAIAVIIVVIVVVLKSRTKESL